MVFRNEEVKIQNKEFKRRIVEISYRLGLSHIGSNITSVDIINEIYSIKNPTEKVIISNGHAHLAHAVVMEKYNQEKVAKRIDDGTPYPPFLPIEFAIKEYGIHCDRKAGCDASTGSLGHGIGIAVGMALADRSKAVYCLLSDGECAEGSVYEAINIMHEQNITNLYLYINHNGWAAYRKSLVYNLLVNDRQVMVVRTDMDDYPDWLQGQEAHYATLDEKRYNELMELLK